ncbi:MAG: hypothetical protein RIA09_15875 [Hoeflea sp.]|jgi:hypothetical protein|uniref:hypothetical protein n=1 Tax=Hoeflea sp. TaxID=1940281 RepID=UPI0032EAC688
MSKMFIAQIVLPKVGNNGDSINHAHGFLKTELCRKFGGFTALESSGGWIDPETGNAYLEPGITYQTGMADTPENVAALLKIAIQVGVAAKQLAMAVTLPSGEFQILQTGVDSLDSIDPETVKQGVANA